MSEGITDFAGRTAFVTGGARGIGLGIARALLRRGASVAIADISADALARATEVLGDDRVRGYQLDVADREQYAEVAARVTEELGNVTLLFNNAGVGDAISPSRVTYEMWDYVMGVNLDGVFNGIHTFLGGMLESGQRCHIVNTASEAGLLTGGAGFLYHSSKFAVMGLSEALREELFEQGVGVSVLFPGPVATEIVLNSRGLRPENLPSHSERALETLQFSHQYLTDEGADPDAVGELVLEAVENNRRYIGTRNANKASVSRRNDKIGEAMDHAERMLAGG